jgi:hypothetical protein
MGWILANIFLIGIVAIAAGYFWLFGSIVKLSEISADAEPYLFALAALVALIATYFTAKVLHALIEKLLRKL